MSSTPDYAKTLRESIKAAMKSEDLDVPALYQRLYGRAGSVNEVQTLRNRLNRGNLTASFVGLCVDRLPSLRATTLELAYLVGVSETG